MKKKVAYMTIAILVLLISVVRILSEPDKNPFETQPTTHLVGQGIQKIVSTVLIWEKFEKNIILFNIYLNSACFADIWFVFIFFKKINVRHFK